MYAWLIAGKKHLINSVGEDDTRFISIAKIRIIVKGEFYCTDLRKRLALNLLYRGGLRSGP